ncbi:putative LRR receptor-like serine/threonine-protein kinase [Planoprotostelium fungivorum]|uniref:non-specific serine/threonine protein kinase n=1 Tax=Planoprotostelium fungivorum TaxID=1890364 RepID=A0A2P6MPI1_9EUKA|nr:putative LRR receptor-like serine/threonine-protein kinase [Planoprotostelium fungivorum]
MRCSQLLVLFTLGVALGVQNVYLHPEDDIQKVVDDKLSRFRNDELVMTFTANDKPWMDSSLIILDRRDVNFTLNCLGVTSLFNSFFVFSGVGKVNIDNLQFQGSAWMPNIHIEGAGDVTISSSFAQTTNFSSIIVSNVESLSMIRCNFTEIRPHNPKSNVILNGNITSLIISHASVYSSTSQTSLWLINCTSDSAHFSNLSFLSVFIQDITGILDFRGNIKRVDIEQSVWTNVQGKYGAAIRVSEGTYDQFSISRSIFEANIARCQLYVDWPIQMGQLLIEYNTFSDALALPLPQGLGPHPAITAGIIVISGVIQSVDMTGNVAQSCLMEKDSAFIAVIYTFGVCKIGSLTIQTSFVFKNEITPIVISSASIDSILIYNNSLSSNSGTSNTMLMGGAVNIIDSNITRLQMQGGDISFNTGSSTGAVYLYNNRIEDLQILYVDAASNRGSDSGGFLYVQSYHGNNQSRINIQDCHIVYNQAGVQGGGVWIAGRFTEISFTGTDFIFNTISQTTGSAGAIYLESDVNTNITIQKGIFQSNSGSQGSAIMINCTTSHWVLKTSSFSKYPPTYSLIQDSSKGFSMSDSTFSGFFLSQSTTSGMINSNPEGERSNYTIYNCLLTNSWKHHVNTSLSSVHVYNFSRNLIPMLADDVISIGRVEEMYIEMNQVETIYESLVSQCASTLRRLSLRNNSMQLLKFVSQPFENLQFLDISENKLSSPLDQSMLPKVETLSMYNNSYRDISFLSAFKSIKTLDLSNNLCEGSLHPFSSISSLQILILTNNAFNGTLEPLLQLRSLTALDITKNQLRGTIPSNLSESCPQLNEMDLSNNRLEGEIPDLSNLPLFALDLNQNQLTATSLAGLSNMSDLAYLDLSWNKIKADLSTLNGLRMITFLGLSGNTFTGRLSLDNLTSLYTLNLDHCDSTHVMIEYESGETHLAYLDLASNQIRSLPKAIENLSSLRLLNLNDNHLKDEKDFSILGALPQIGSLYLDKNMYTTGLSHLNAPTLISLSVSHNKLMEDISSVKNLVNLKYLDLSNNNIQGDLDDLSGLHDLEYLDLSHNLFTTTIPPSFHNLKALYYLDLSYNQLTGEFISFQQTMTLSSHDRSRSSSAMQSISESFHLPDRLGYVHCLLHHMLRLRIVGELQMFNQASFVQNLANMTNITASRMEVTHLESGSVIIDLNIQPPGTKDINQASAKGVVKYLKEATAGEYLPYGILILNVTDIPHKTTTPSAGTPPWLSFAIVAASCATLILIIITISALLLRKSYRRQMELTKVVMDETGTKYNVIDRTEIGSAESLTTERMDDLARDSIQITSRIGEGAYGIVYQGVYKVKQIKSASMPIVEDFMSEVELMKRLTPHPNVVQFLGFCPKPLALITEYIPRGNLYRYLRTNPDIPYETKINIIKGVVAGMAHLAEERVSSLSFIPDIIKVIHKDLAARNVLLDGDLTPKVADFGMSRVLTIEAEEHQSITNIGPIKWMAPESLKTKIFSEKSDVWSWAVLVIEIITGEEPFPNISGTEFFIRTVSEDIHSKMLNQVDNANMNQDRLMRGQIPKNWIDNVLSHTLMYAFEMDPKKRPTFATIATWLQKSGE